MAKVQRPGPAHGQARETDIAFLTRLDRPKATELLAPNLCHSDFDWINELGHGKPTGKLRGVKLVEGIVDICGGSPDVNLGDLSHSTEYILCKEIGFYLRAAQKVLV